MGRSRKPLEMQKGNLTVKQQVAMEQAEEMMTVGKEQLTAPPKWLINKVAKDEFARVVKEMEKVQIFGNLDLNNLGCYCNAFAMYQKVMSMAKVRPADKDLADILKKHADEMRKFAALCGLTIDSRLKLGTSLAEQKDNEIEENFGNI